MSFFLITVLILSLNPGRSAGYFSARDVYERAKACAVRTDSVLDHREIRFTQKMQIESRSGDEDNLVFRITIKNGRFERDLVSGTVPNGSRFNAGYDAFNKMFFLSEYFSDKGKSLSSCEFADPNEDNDYRIRFAFSEPSDTGNPLSTVTASISRSDFAPRRIEENIKGLPLGMEFHDAIDVSYDSAARIYFPSKIVMQIYGKFFFLHGEIGKVIIRNEKVEVL